MKLIQSGPRQTNIVIVGEAPGEKEARDGIPFVGGSGMLLDDSLNKAGISRADCFVTNVCHTRPPNNEFKWFLQKANQPLLMQGIVQLKRDIETIKPNLVIAFGDRPLQYLTGKMGITKWRGSILESILSKNQKVIATYHPAYCLRIWDYKAVLDIDLVRCAEEAKFPQILRPQRDYLLDPAEDIRPGILRELCSAEWLSIDIECVEKADGTWALSCVGFSDRPDRAVVIPVRGIADVHFVRAACASSAKKVFQNGSFDVTVLAQNGIEVTNFVWDTMLAHHSIYTECAGGEDEVALITKKGKAKQQAAIQKGLAFQTSIYTREPFYKDDGKLWKETGDLNLFWLYNGRDAAVTREIRDVQEKDIREFGVEQVFQHEMDLVTPLLSATAKGILVDKVMHQQLMDKYEKEIANLQAFLDGQAGGPVNVKSAPAMQELLYGKLGLPPQKKRRADGGYTVTADKDAINLLAEKHPHPLLLTILEIRERRDIIERYLNTAYDADGAMRCSFDITGTRTGRLASRSSLSGSGTNLQNQPEEIRQMYISRKGKVFILRDYSQAEARVVAYIAGAKGLIELFEDPTRDIHYENAARIFQKALDQISIEERYLAKRGVHAANYGMQAEKLMRVVNADFKETGIRITLAQAKQILDAYFMLYPEIKSVYWRGVERKLREQRMLTSCFGRKRLFFGRMDDKLIRDGYSWEPQSTVGDLCCKALVKCYHAIPEADLLLNVHDSIMMETDEANAETVAEKMRQCMDIPLTINGQTFKIPTDCMVGYNWGKRPKKNPETNPRGLVALDKYPNWRELLAA